MHYQQRRLALLAEAAIGPTVLDIGYVSLPNPYLQDLTCVGFDKRLPDEHGMPYQEAIRGDVQDIAHILAGRQFDSILCGELIEHLENPYQFLRDVHGLLADHGRLILSTPNPLGFPVFVCELLRIKRFFYTRWHTYYFLPRWVERLLDHTGYEVLQIRPVGLWLSGVALAVVPVALSYQVVYVARKKP
ncbi:MAG: methyltransferase domain-containing protein [Chloroflexaceae bacterium]|nr:methyltransferase domain-containing protein [Chloroflexaceae bacterium]